MIIKRYLTREIFSALITITTILLLAFLSQQIVRYLNYVALGKIPTNVLVQLISFEIPYLLALLLPLGLYLAILLAYGRLFSNNEMAILQLAGFSGRRLLRLTFVVAGVVSIFVLFLMLTVNPLISAKREEVIASDAGVVQLVKTLMPGRFEVSPDGKHVMYVESVSGDDKRAENVFLAQEKKVKKDQQDDLNQWSLVLAREGYQATDPETKEPYFITKNGYRYEGTPGQNDYKIIRYGTYGMRIPQNEAQIKHDAEEGMSSAALWNSYDKPKYAAEFQWRISIGITTLLLALMAIPMSAMEPRKGRYLILLPAILVYVVYINLLFIARHWVEIARVPPYIGIWWVHGLMAFIILLVFFISKRRRA